jgi:hypothetical protein
MTLSANAVRNIKASCGKVLQQDLADMYGVSRYTIAREQRGKRTEVDDRHSYRSRRVPGVEEKSIICPCGVRLEFDTLDGILQVWCPKCGA